MEMMLPSYELEQAYYNALNNKVTYNDIEVPYYSSGVPKNAPDIYIYASTSTFSDDSNKSKWVLNFQKQLVIVSRQNSNKGTKKHAYNVASEVVEIIRERGRTSLIMDNFVCVSSILESGSDASEQTDNEFIFVIEMTFNHIIQQK